MDGLFMKPLEELLEIVKSAKENPWINQANSHQDIATLTLADAVIDLITQLKDAQAEIKSLNTFNTQFTRADKISWGGLYIQVEQLEQRLAECETALKKALEFGEYADWAIDADKNLQQLDIDSRAYLTKWGVK